MAPEVVKQTAYTHKDDIWSVGCIVVEMLTGTHPWASLNQMQAIFQVIHSSFVIPFLSIYFFLNIPPRCTLTQIGSMAKPAIPSDISAEAGEFLQRTFEINHEARPSAADLLQGGWIVKGPSSGGGGGGNGGNGVSGVAKPGTTKPKGSGKGS